MSNNEKNIQAINDYIKKFMWMELAYEVINLEQIKIVGSIDLVWEEPYIEIIFDKPITIFTPLNDWITDDEKPLVQLATKQEAIGVIKYVSDDFPVFKINADGYDEAPVWIAAKSISFNIKKQPE